MTTSNSQTWQLNADQVKRYADHARAVYISIYEPWRIGDSVIGVLREDPRKWLRELRSLELGCARTLRAEPRSPPVNCA